MAKQLHIDNTDIRGSHDTDLFDQDLVYGFTVNNNPTVSDLWNSTPAWGFPYVSSKLAQTPSQVTQVDNTLQERVAGGGFYAMWNDLVYLEFNLYGGLGYNVLNATGIVPVYNADQYQGPIPYWRLALQQNFGRSYAQIGTYGLQDHVSPGGITVAGLTDQYTDVAVDTNYQFTFNPKSVVGDMISAHATFIHEEGVLNASQAILGSRPVHELNTARADVSYSFAATVTPSVQIFQTSGTSDAAYWGTPSGRPNSSGTIAEIAYVPWGKPDSLISWGNIRFAVQYVNYFTFDGTSRGASNNNALFFSVWAAAHF